MKTWKLRSLVCLNIKIVPCTLVKWKDFNLMVIQSTWKSPSFQCNFVLHVETQDPNIKECVSWYCVPKVIVI